MKQIVCPISNEQVNESLTRLNAFFTIMLVIAGFVFNSVLFPLVLLADFYVRAFTKSKFSPLSVASAGLARLLNLNNKPTDKAPKIFAARLGFIMTLMVATLFLLQLYTASMIVAGVLIFCALLEFAFNICLGCIIYTFLVLPLYK
ncbi:DUF4395 domain-containing protein [Mariniphaga sediminis]|jgi:hypothetical protein|uniref:DUF4395 domain-containing protein n=1 Tax=Mariniphaga sediminis TaxID=1628158 RepID=A0A399D4Q1_9BACT|nr:DUF4395 domain-containing protein [Mariniphaga sediminis]RIH65652.1 DUF4395 domain-containing protein [Mariniphaga sediminis]